MQLHSILTLALDGGKWSASCTGRLTLGKELPGSIQWESGWVAPGAGAACRGTSIASAGGRPKILWTSSS